MFLASVALIGLILAVATRRPLGRLVERRFHQLWILWLAIGLHLLLVPPALQPVLSHASSSALPPMGALVYLTSLSLLVVFACANLWTPGISLIGLGLLMNALVISANGGQMPIDQGQLVATGQMEDFLDLARKGEWSSWTIMGSQTRLSFLGDWLWAPRPFVGPVILSPGDLVIAAGILAFFLLIPEGRKAEDPALSSLEAESAGQDA